MTGPLYAKPRPHALVRADKQRARKAKDEAENRKVRQRSGGQCERVEEINPAIWRRCARRASQVHHLIGGIGRRNIAEGSVLAAHKLRVCDLCHGDITQHILVPAPGCNRERASYVRYMRVR